MHLEVELNNKIRFFDAWVHKEHRRKGIFRKLWNTRWKFVQEKFLGYVVYAWCKPMSLPLLLEKGFREGETCVYVEKKIAKQFGEAIFLSYLDIKHIIIYE